MISDPKRFGATLLIACVVGCGGSNLGSVDRLDPSGIVPTLRVLGPTVEIAPPSENGHAASGPSPRYLFVSDSRKDAVDVFKPPSYLKVRSILTGLNKPAGLWVDSHGNLYVADYKGRNVSEYAPGAASPSCIYSSGLADPINITTNASGDVFVVDYNFGSAGHINVYKQCADSISSQYDISGGPEGAAVDKSGNLFVSFNAFGNGELEEFLAGSMSPTPLGVTLEFSGGLALDAHGNLLACDQVSGYVDVIAPPYQSISSTYGLFSDPFNVALGSHGRELLLADPGAHDVEVLDYPSGVRVAKLTRRDGLGLPLGVASLPNGSH